MCRREANIKTLYRRREGKRLHQVPKAVGPNTRLHIGEEVGTVKEKIVSNEK